MSFQVFARTRNNQLLRDAGLTYPQFVLLLHFCHDPDREWTVGTLARAFQRNQPAAPHSP
jgi:hypothetical protein